MQSLSQANDFVVQVLVQELFLLAHDSQELHVLSAPLVDVHLLMMLYSSFNGGLIERSLNKSDVPLLLKRTQQKSSSGRRSETEIATSFLASEGRHSIILPSHHVINGVGNSTLGRDNPTQVVLVRTKYWLSLSAGITDLQVKIPLPAILSKCHIVLVECRVLNSFPYHLYFHPLFPSTM